MASKAAGNTTVTYNSNAITAYCDKAELDAAAETVDVTDLASTANEFITTFANWSIPLGGPWDPTLDGYLAPDAVTTGTARTAVITFSDGTTTITYTWTSTAYLENYKVSSSSPTDAIRWEATLKLSGAPVRS